MRKLWFVLLTLALATAMHLDWHLARPAEHHLSAGWGGHWLAAIPVFALVAWAVYRLRPVHLLESSVAVLGIAGLLAAVVEPGWEYLVGDAPFDWAFGPVRLIAFAAFSAVGIVAYLITFAILSRRTPPE